MIKITPYPTANYMTIAMANPGAVSIDAKYIGVGEGFQDIAGNLDDAGRSTISTLAKPVAWLPILKGKKIGDYQHQLVVDFSSVVDRTWNFSECCLADENKTAIAIYGHPSQALQTVSPNVDVALIAINMVLGTFPANSINIIHQNAPLQLFMTKELLAMDAAIGGLTLSQMYAHDARIEKEKAEAARREIWEKTQQNQQGAFELLVKNMLTDLQNTLRGNQQAQTNFNHVIENAIGGLSMAIIH